MPKIHPNPPVGEGNLRRKSTFETDADNENVQSGPKRPIGKGESRAAHKYPRKRAVAACQFCRTRRIKCSNERPSCSSCAAIGTQCIYTSYQTDHSSFDPASLLILDKLDKILVRLDGNPVVGAEQNMINSALTPSSQQGVSHNDKIPSETVDKGPSPRTQVPDVSTFEYLKIPSGRTSADSILTWPIFGNRFGPEYLTNEVLAAAIFSQADLTDNGHTIRPSSYGVVNDQDVPFLLERFLAFVHVKNPFLDARLLKQYGRRMAEDGPQWDAPSCLVLLACALGALALPFEFEVKTPETIQDQQLPCTRTRESKQMAESFHQLAVKRFGILTCSIIKSQCHMLSAIYLMYTIQPIRAWNDFLQASNNYFMYLRSQMACKIRSTVDIMGGYSESRRLEQSLYWTCFKSECEMREEMSLPESGLSELHYPYMFPSPPRSGTPEAASQAVFSNPSGPWDVSTLDNLTENPIPESDSQQSWLYYMTEIALRRIGNRVSNAFYHSDHTYWATFNICEAHEIAQQFELQLDEWLDLYLLTLPLPNPAKCHLQASLCTLTLNRKESLPESLRFNTQLGHVDELRCMTHGRYLCIKFRLYRPFIYHFIHTHSTDQLSHSISQAYARKAIACCTDEFVGYPATHRHHGTWFMCRLIISKALIILAVKKSGKSELPDHWRGSIEEMLGTLGYWEMESPDVKKGREIIEGLYAEVGGNEVWE